MDATAIHAISDLAINSQLSAELRKDLAIVPKSAQIETLEKFNREPNHFRGVFNTTLIGIFIAYINNHARGDHSAVFIDPDTMQASCIVDMGTPDLPEWGYHRANAKLKKTPEYDAVLQNNFQTLQQQALIDFAEDWEAFIRFYDQDGQGIPFRQVINTLRRVKLNATASTDQTIDNYAGSRSTLEQVEVRSGADLLPAGFTFTAQPYDAFLPRELDCQLRAVTDDKNVKFKYRIKALDNTIAEIAREFSQLITKSSSAELPIYLGEMKYQ